MCKKSDKRSAKGYKRETELTQFELRVILTGFLVGRLSIFRELFAKKDQTQKHLKFKMENRRLNQLNLQGINYSKPKPLINHNSETHQLKSTAMPFQHKKQH